MFRTVSEESVLSVEQMSWINAKSLTGILLRCNKGESNNRISQTSVLQNSYPF